MAVTHADLGEYYLYCDGEAPLLFTENETNNERLFPRCPISPFVKDGINNYVVNGQKDAVNPGRPAPKCRRTTGLTLVRGSQPRWFASSDARCPRHRRKNGGWRHLRTGL